MDWLENIIIVMAVWFFAGVLIKISEDQDQ